MSGLSDSERARAAEMKRQWIEAFGDYSVIRELYKAGLIEGWRDVLSVRKLNGNDELAVPPENGNGC